MPSAKNSKLGVADANTFGILMAFMAAAKPSIVLLGPEGTVT